MTAHYPPPLCHPSTREKVLKIISDWIDDSYPRQRIADWWHLFFFLRNTPDRGVASRLFLTLAWQMATSIPETLPYIESALKAERSLYSKSINIQFDREPPS